MKSKLWVLSLLISPQVYCDPLDEVIVTAQRRLQNIQDVPMSVTVITQTDLSAKQIDTTKQLLTNSPNVIGNNNLGQQQALTLFIRGVGTTENLATADTSVGVYVDGVYISRQGFNNLQLLDVDSVEILRGPQGTLYGRNTNGGAIKIAHTKPNWDQQAEFTAGYGRANYIYGDAIINAPINDNLSVRYNLGANKSDGLVRAVNLNKNVNDGTNMTGRIAARYVMGQLDINLQGDYSKSYTNGNFQTDIAGIITPRPTNLFTTLSTYDAYNRGEQYGGNLNIAIPLGDSGTFESITGYRNIDQTITSDASGEPPGLSIFYQHQVSKQISQEFQVSGNLSSNIDYLGGVYVLDEDAVVYLADTLRQSPTQASLNLYKDFNVVNTNYAAYGDIKYTWNKTTVQAGARYSDESKVLDITQTSNNTQQLYNFNTQQLNARGVGTNNHYSSTTPKLSIQYKFNNNATLYAQYVLGYRAGGWTGRATRVDQYVSFQPEKARTYEAGLKANGSGWVINTALFATDYTNFFNTLTVNGAFTVQPADARINGLEIEGKYNVYPWLQFYGSLGLLDGKYKANRPINLATELQRAPKYQSKVGTKANWNNFEFNISAYAVAKYRLTPANLLVTAPALANSGVEVTGPYKLVDSKVTWTNNNTSINIQCTNCFNKHYVEGGVFVGQWAGAWMGSPLMWSINVNQRF